MRSKIPTPRTSAIAVLAIAGVLAAPSAALGHARVSPAVSISGQLQLYSLAVPTEKSKLTTTKVVMTVPSGFSIDSFVPPPAGWKQTLQQSGAGGSAVVQKVTWTGGSTPSGEDSLFQFLAQPASARNYTFAVQQTYSDGSIVDWAGSESSSAPAPTIEVKSSLGGSSSVSLLAIIALVVGALGLVVGGFALITSADSGGSDESSGSARGGRPLA